MAEGDEGSEISPGWILEDGEETSAHCVASLSLSELGLGWVGFGGQE